ncbi:MAG TPA: tetratricopeptide repeat protein [Blastocatellia bacterium]|nr:tetratricopeptide repeat protein [Blastocatellia bacterium]
MSIAGTEVAVNAATAKSSRPRWLAPAMVSVLGAIAYIDTFKSPFIFDDEWITHNRDIRQLWPLTTVLFSKANVHRPMVALSFAINYAISGLNVWSYHAVNLTIHILAALTLFGIVKVTLTGERLRGRFGANADSLALAVALVWMLHPIQTMAVTYTVQRCESLMGLFYLLTLYAAIRGFDSGSRKWYALSIAACAAGMLSKQVMVTAPVLVLLYDVLFVTGSLRTSFVKRKWFYLGLAGTWAVLAATLIAAPTNQTAGFAVKTITPLRYLLSEFGVIVYYLRLAFWPSPLCLDYVWPRASTAAEIVPFAIIVGALVFATIYCVMRLKPAGYLGAWFFLVLSVTSSIMPFDDLIFEHRLYLPLAAVAALVVLGGYSGGRWLLDRAAFRYGSPAGTGGDVGRRLALASIVIVVAALGFLTLRRNVDYRNPMTLWMDVLAKQPQNGRARNNLGVLLLEKQDFDAALPQFELACLYSPNSTNAHCNLGLTLSVKGRYAEARQELNESLRIKPDFDRALFNLGQLSDAEGKDDEAISLFHQTLDLNPSYQLAHLKLGQVLERTGKLSEAREHYEAERRLYPESTGASPGTAAR